MRALAIATSKSLNRKTGTAAVTYAAQQSCPSSCVFLNAGCYAEGASIGIHTRRLNAAAKNRSATEVALAEAEAIDAMEVRFPGQALRLHSVGDCASNLAARIVARACARWEERGGGPVWTYTHAWREVDRDAWGTIRVLASCETTEDIFWARQAGYATAVVVERFQRRSRYVLDGAPLGQDVIPCPAQTADASCTDCRLCFDVERLRREGLTIAFAVHGDAASQRQAVATLGGRPVVKLREIVPVMLAEGKTGADIARATGTNQSSVYEMIRRLRAEGVVA